MKLILQLAYRNCIKGGLRTWLNVGVLSFTFVLIIFFDGLMDGWNEQAKSDSILWEYGNGQVWHQDYDPQDPFTLNEAVGNIDLKMQEKATPILIQQGSIYPQQRMIPVQLKGILPSQKIVKLPTDLLINTSVETPALIGKRMAETAQLKVNDKVLLRWKDKHGVFDARKITIVGIFDTNVGSVDNNQIWLPLEKLQNMTRLTNKATLWVANDAKLSDEIKGSKSWKFVSQKDLLKDMEELVQMKKSSNSIFYLMLLSIALLAIFDTQVLSIFRRQKEIGTYLALGMTKLQVMFIFTLEGAMYSILAVILGFLYGTPILMYLQNKGLYIPNADDLGLAIADRIYPYFSFKVVINTILLIIVSATLVSYLPVRKIAKLNPVNALKGKLS